MAAVVIHAIGRTGVADQSSCGQCDARARWRSRVTASNRFRKPSRLGEPSYLRSNCSGRCDLRRPCLFRNLITALRLTLSSAPISESVRPRLGSAWATRRRDGLLRFALKTVASIAPAAVVYGLPIHAEFGRCIHGLLRWSYPAASIDTPSTRELWVYDFRTNQHFTLKTQPLERQHLDDFVAQYRPGERHKREEAENFRRWTYDDLDARPDFNLDIWASVEDKSLEEAANIPPPEVLAEEIITTVSAALNEFAVVAAEFGVELDANASPQD
jgi:hypothetical protein